MANFKSPQFNSQTHIPLMEMFYSLQGEGFNTGQPAFFIRLAGCNVECSWCDVKESWNTNENSIIAIDDIVHEALKHAARFVVITGGEPTLYDLTSLTNKLKSYNFEIAIETSGTNTIIGKIDWICLSPKKFKLPLAENYSKANELKLIVVNNHDFQWALDLQKFVNTNCKLYLQPEWDKRNTLINEIIAFVKCNPRWRISLQTHKYLNIP